MDPTNDERRSTPRSAALMPIPADLLTVPCPDCAEPLRGSSAPLCGCADLHHQPCPDCGRSLAGDPSWLCEMTDLHLYAGNGSECLDWRPSAHWSGSRRPCRLCGSTTHLRDGAGRPAHKVCVQGQVADLLAAASTTSMGGA